MMREVIITEFLPRHQPAFENLNRQWIEKYFWMEPIDVEVLQNPDQHILQPGGKIFMAEWQDHPVGTVAVKLVANGLFEFTKMAVAEEFQGLKIGRALAKAAIDYCREQNARYIILYSNTKLESAINLYYKLGFHEVPLDGPYKRSNIKMQLDLKSPSV